MARARVAVDIGAYSIKMAQILPGAQGPRLEILASTRIPPGAVRDGEVVDDFEVTECIRELMAATGIGRGSRASTCVGGPSVIVKVSAYPGTSANAVRDAAIEDAAGWAPGGADALIEAHVVPAASAAGTRDVAIAAAARPAVESRVSAVAKAGLVCDDVDAEPFALLRSLIYASANTALFVRPVAVLQLGETYGSLTILRRGAFALYRPIKVAGAALTKAVGRALAIPYPDAEALKETHAATPGGEPGAAVVESDRATDALAPPLLELVGEVRLALNQYASQYEPEGVGKVEAVLLTGGTAMLRGLEQYLTQALGTRVFAPGLFDALALDPSAFDPQYLRLCAPSSAGVVGLALAPFLASGRYRPAVDPSVFGVVHPRDRQAS